MAALSWRSLSVGKKIILGSLLSLIPMLVIVYTAFSFSSSSSLASSDVIQTLLVRNFSEKINGFLQKQAVLFHEWTREDIFGMAIDFQELGEINEEMGGKLAAAPGMDLLLVTGLDGNVLYSSDPKRVALKTPLPWALPLLEKPPGHITLVDNAPTPEGGVRPSFLFSFPARDTNGQMNGIFLAYTNWSALEKEMQTMRANLAQSGYPNSAAAILDWKTGQFLNQDGQASSLVTPKDFSPEESQWFLGGYDLTVRKIKNNYVSFANLAQPETFAHNNEEVLENPAHLLLVAFIPHQDVHGKVDDLLFRSIAIAFAGALLIIVVALFISRTITSPIEDILSVIRSLSRGELTNRCPVSDIGDEIIHIGQGVNTMANSLEKMIRSVVLETETILAILAALTQTSTSLQEDTQKSLEMGMQAREANQLIDEKNSSLSEQTDFSAKLIQSIYRSTEELSENNMVVASGTEEASANVATVAVAAEEMSANIGSVTNALTEVNQSVVTVANSITDIKDSMEMVRNRCRKASDASTHANQLSGETVSVMERLSVSATAIGQVIELILSIAEQTNMLALNAAIEAAGAGQAGKGFSVVSYEIKDLSARTADATQLIESRVEEIQLQTQEVSDSMDRLSNTIEEIDQINRAITYAMDEQGYTLNILSDSVDAVAVAANEVTRNADELNTGSQDVSRAASEASLGAADIAQSTADSQTIAQRVASETSDANQRIQEVYNAVRDIATASNKARELGENTANLLQFNLKASESVGQLSKVVEKSANGMALSVRGFQIGEAPFDVGLIKGSQLHWMAQLERLLRGQNEESVPDLNTLPLAHCLDECAAHFEGHPSHKHLKWVFEQMGDASKEIVRLAESKDTSVAQENISELKRLGEEASDHLDVLYLRKSPEEVSELLSKSICKEIGSDGAFFVAKAE